MGWVAFGGAVLIMGPIVGVVAVAAFFLFHEMGGPQRRASRLAAPCIARRASTELLEEYLVDSRLYRRGVRQLRGAAVVRRADTATLRQYLKERHMPLAPRTRAVYRAPRLVPLSA